MSSLQIQNITKNFGDFTAVQNFSAEFHMNEISAVIGPNGAGKTTMVNTCTGLFYPDEGKIYFDDLDITRLKPHKRVNIGIARTFQIINIFSDLTVYENLKVPFLFKKISSSIVESTHNLLHTCGLSDLAYIKASNISHGDQKLLELGMALALNPKLIFLDEPKAGVSAEEKERIISMILNLKENNIIPVLIEHDMETIFRIADKIIVMNNGELLAEGDPEVVKNNEFVKKVYLKEEIYE